MRRWLTCLVFLLVLPLQAWAQAAQVSSGEHAEFTRIVVQFPGPVDWTMGRTSDGYELRVPQAGTQYNLTRVFDLIRKDRLAAIFADPQSGALRLTIACACFAIPFEFRPGTVVIDIRNGDPPVNSAFEQPLDGAQTAETTETPPAPPIPPAPNDAAPGYDWTAMLLQPQRPAPAPPGLEIGPSAETPKPVTRDLEPLRQSLIEELSRGASAGIVDMAKPKRPLPSSGEENPNPSVDVHDGEVPNLILRQKGEEDLPMTSKGLACITDEQVDVASWSLAATSAPEAAEGEAAPETPPSDEAAPAPAPSGEPAADVSIGGPLKPDVSISMQFAPARSNLTGEFDRPDHESVKRAVRFALHIGFGAEARSLLRAFPIEDDDKPIWESMARIADEEPDPNPVFAGMEACDTAAALWAVLADPKVLGVGQVEKTAILRAFSALPVHLRQHFGPTLVDRFLAMQDFGTATALRDAVTRGHPEAGPEVEMMQAAIDKASGSPGASVKRLETVAAESGPSNAEAMVALVLQRAELGQEVSYDQVRTIEEYAKERTGSGDHERFQQALTLAYAASGDFDSAFANLANGPDAAAVLWNLLGNAAPDSALLTYAALEEGQEPPRSARGSAGLIAERLLRLGLADQAAQWLAVANEAPDLLSAKIAVAQGLSQKALDLLGDLKTPSAIQVRLEALRQMGDEPAIAALFEELGMTEERWNSVSRTRDWESLAAEGPDLWKAAAATLAEKPEAEPAPPAGDAPPLPPDGPLATGQALIEESVSTRDAITALLNSVKSPAAPSQ